jgi:hypothetical protein
MSERRMLEPMSPQRLDLSPTGRARNIIYSLIEARPSISDIGIRAVSWGRGSGEKKRQKLLRNGSPIQPKYSSLANFLSECVAI